MKILYSCLSQSWGGMEMFTVQSAGALLKRGIHTELLCYPASRIHIEAEKQNIRTHLIKADKYFHPLQILKLRNVLKKNSFDLIHTQASKDLWVLVPALNFSENRFKHISLILTKQVGSFIIKKDVLHKKIYNRLTAAFAISNVIKKNLIETTPLPESKIFLVHNGVDTKKFNPEISNGFIVRNEFEITEKQLIIGMLARFSPGKGHEEFLFAAKELLAKYPHLIFMIVGEASRGEEKYAENIKNLAKEFNVEEKVIFTGFRKDTPEILASMDIFVFPSHSEAFGIALAEAMAMAKPSVCSNSDGILDIAVEGVTSYLFNKGNGKDLAEKLELLITLPEKRIEFGRSARKRAIENFEIELLIDKTINIYNQLITGIKK